MEIKFYKLMTDWLVEQYPSLVITTTFSPYINDDMIIGLGKVLSINGMSVGRITDVEFHPWSDHSNAGTLHAADPEFFDKFKAWIKADVLPRLNVVRDI